MTDEERTLSTRIDLPDDAPTDPDRYQVAVYVRPDGEDGDLTRSERVDPEYYALDDGDLTVADYPFRADRVLHRLTVSWDGDWTFDDLDDADIGR